MIVKDVLHLSDRDLAVLELYYVEPAASVFTIIELKHKVLEEDVPTQDII